MTALAAHEWLLTAGSAWLVVLLVALVVRTLQAPTVPERIVALDLLSIVLVAILALLAGRQGEALFLDAALALALLSFLGTLAAARAQRRKEPLA